MDKDLALSLSSELVQFDVSEEWREYDWTGRVYRVTAPVTVEYRPGGTTHRVLDVDGVWHVLPAPGHFGCVIRVKPDAHDSDVF